MQSRAYASATRPSTSLVRRLFPLSHRVPLGSLPPSISTNASQSRIHTSYLYSGCPGSYLPRILGQGFEPSHLINAAESPARRLRRVIQVSVAVFVSGAVVVEPAPALARSQTPVRRTDDLTLLAPRSSSRLNLRLLSTQQNTPVTSPQQVASAPPIHCG